MREAFVLNFDHAGEEGCKLLGHPGPAMKELLIL